MQTDEAFEEDLRLQFSMMEAPEPKPGLIEETVRKYRRWRMRRRLMVASPALMLAGAVGTAAGLGVFGGSGAGQPAVQSEIGTASMRLARFTFPLPKGYQLASIDTACRALVLFTNPTRTGLPTPSTGSHAYTPPRVAQLYPASSSPQTSTMAAAAATDGGCLLMALSVPFVPTQSTANPYLATSGQRIEVDGYAAWLTASANTSNGSVQLAVQLPAGKGTFEDLGIGARGLSAQTLLTVVSQGLANSSS